MTTEYQPPSRAFHTDHDQSVVNTMQCPSCAPQAGPKIGQPKPFKAASGVTLHLKSEKHWDKVEAAFKLVNGVAAEMPTEAQPNFPTADTPVSTPVDFDPGNLDMVGEALMVCGVLVTNKIIMAWSHDERKTAWIWADNPNHGVMPNFLQQYDTGDTGDAAETAMAKATVHTGPAVPLIPESSGELVAYDPNNPLSMMGATYGVEWEAANAAEKEAKTAKGTARDNIEMFLRETLANTEAKGVVLTPPHTAECGISMGACDCEYEGKVLVYREVDQHRESLNTEALLAVGVTIDQIAAGKQINIVTQRTVKRVNYSTIAEQI